MNSLIARIPSLAVQEIRTLFDAFDGWNAWALRLRTHSEYRKSPVIIDEPWPWEDLDAMQTYVWYEPPGISAVDLGALFFPHRSIDAVREIRHEMYCEEFGLSGDVQPLTSFPDTHIDVATERNSWTPVGPGPVSSSGQGPPTMDWGVPAENQSLFSFPNTHVNVVTSQDTGTSASQGSVPSHGQGPPPIAGHRFELNAAYEGQPPSTRHETESLETYNPTDYGNADTALGYDPNDTHQGQPLSTPHNTEPARTTSPTDYETADTTLLHQAAPTLTSSPTFPSTNTVELLVKLFVLLKDITLPWATSYTRNRRFAVSMGSIVLEWIIQFLSQISYRKLRTDLYLERR
jgi:hypothetical protein